MNFPDWGELCISSQNQRKDLVGEVVACTGEHISYIYMCYTIQYVSYLDSIVNFRHFIYMLVKIIFYCFLILFCWEFWKISNTGTRWIHLKGKHFFSCDPMWATHIANIHRHAHRNTETKIRGILFNYYTHSCNTNIPWQPALLSQ
jgi:hypothetical protein